jgi:hypothetical protein
VKTIKLSVVATIAVFVFAAPLAMPQTPQDVSAAKATAFAEAYLAASDAAERPGDAKLTCDQLGIELITITSDAKLQNAAKKMGAPEEIVASAAEYRAGMDKTVAAMRALRVLGYLASAAQIMVPGLAQFAPTEVVGAAETALIVSREKQTVQMQSQMLDKISVLTPVLPQYARSVVVGELAEEHNCEFLKKLKEQAKEK